MQCRQFIVPVSISRCNITSYGFRFKFQLRGLDIYPDHLTIECELISGSRLLTESVYFESREREALLGFWGFKLGLDRGLGEKRFSLAQQVDGLKENPLRLLLVVSLVALPINVAYFIFASRFGTQGFSMAAINYGRDFVNFWSGGYLTLSSDAMTLYDIDGYRAFVAQKFTPEKHLIVFSYPPSILILLAPFGAFSPAIGLLVWSVIGLAAYWFCCFYGTKTKHNSLSLVLIATCPPVLFTLMCGQFGFYLAACFVGSLRLLPSKPILAGALIGILTIKPQLGPLLVLALLMRREWLAIASATLVTLALFACSVALGGMAIWTAYFETTVPNQNALLRDMDQFFAYLMTTPYSFFFWMGASPSLAMGLQAAASAFVLLATILVLRRKDLPWSLQVAVIACGATLLSPYVLLYDLTILCAALFWYFVEERPRLTNFATMAVGSFYFLAFAPGILLQLLGLPVVPVVVLLVFIALLQHALGQGSKMEPRLL